jgi:tRNA (guanine-N7-)-methyltransferase
MLPPMMSAPEPRAPRTRMTVGGKLSFRRRVQRLEVDPGSLPLRDGGDDPPALDDLVPAAFTKVEVEVGPGKGAFLAAAAQARPDTFFLGIEAAISYAQLAAAALAEQGTTKNALLLVDNAVLWLKDRCPEGRLDRLHVYFPDPWPKRRHRGRRFFTDATPALVHRVLRRDGHLLVATDEPAYAGQIVRVLGASPLLRRDEALEQALADAPGHGFSPTDFERKYLREGRPIRRYAFARVEPDHR